MGGPPGAHSGNRRRGLPQDWELRDQTRLGERFEILESEDDDGQGVTLDPNGYLMREARQRGYAGDGLFLDGYDLGQDRGASKRGMYDAAYDEYLSEEDDYNRLRDMGYVAALQQKQDHLLHSALDRISRARARGQTNINLTQEEMEALERRGSQQPEPSSTLASPPVTPAKTKTKTASRHSSTNSLNGKPRKKSSSGFFSSPAKSNSKAKVTRKSSPDHTVSPPPGHVVIEGPDGFPMYAPIYQGPASPEQIRGVPSRTGSRSSSKHSRRATTPPDQLPPLPPQPRFYQSMRPESQGSYRPAADDADRHTPRSRARSVSNAHSTGYRTIEDYDMAPPLPAAQGRRVSGPTDVRYASLRRTAPSSPLASRAIPVHSGASNLRRVETSGSSSSDDQGVLVDIVEDDHGGFSIRNMPAQLHHPEPMTSTASPAKSGSEARKRKTRR